MIQLVQRTPQPPIAQEPVTLTVTLSHYRSTPKHRRYFNSDEAHAAHVRHVEFYNGRCGTQDLTYRTPIRNWTGVELDRLIADVIALLDQLPHDPEDEADRRRWHPYLKPGTAKHVSFERTTGGRRHMYWHNFMVVHSALSPHTARVALPEPIPAAALATVVDVHGQCRFELTMSSNLPYEPMATAPAIALHGARPRREAPLSAFVRKAAAFERAAPARITRLVDGLIDDLVPELGIELDADDERRV